MNDDLNSVVADLQAQIVALRFAMEGAWLSLLSPDPNAAAAAKRLGEQNAAAIRSYTTNGGVDGALSEAVVRHTEQLWGSIAWQLGEGKQG